jgi:hypothetical protein
MCSSEKLLFMNDKGLSKNKTVNTDKMISQLALLKRHSFLASDKHVTSENQNI